MNVTMCANNHYFDNDMYDSCPICGAAVKSNTRNEFALANDKKAKKGLFHKNKESIERTVKTNIPSQPVEHYKRENISRELSDHKKIISEPKNFGSEPTIDFWNTNGLKPLEDVVEDVSNTGKMVNKNDETEMIQNGNISKKEIKNKNEAGTDNFESQQNVDKTPLSEEIKKVSANIEGKTISYFSATNKQMVDINTEFEPIDPVVGWLVSTGGEHFGDSFKIAAGKNSIGRSSDNKIVISRDKAVSRGKHALIIYEPKKRKFYLQPGDSSGLTYLNGDDVFETKMLSAKDIIEIGNSKFMFIPLCDDTFSWDDCVEKE